MVGGMPCTFVFFFPNAKNVPWPYKGKKKKKKLRDM